MPFLCIGHTLGYSSKAQHSWIHLQFFITYYSGSRLVNLLAEIRCFIRKRNENDKKHNLFYERQQKVYGNTKNATKLYVNTKQHSLL